MIASLQGAIVIIGLLPILVAATGPDPHQDLADLNEQGKYAEAEAIARERLASVEARSGPESVEAADVIDQLVTALWRLGKVKDGEALRLAERTVRIREALPSTRPEDLAHSLSGLSQVLAASGDVRGSLPLLERALALREKALGPDDPQVGRIVVTIGIMHGQLGEFPAARTYFGRALEVARRTLPPGDPELGFSLVNLGNVELRLGDYESALARYEEGWRIWEAAYGPDHPHTIAALRNIAGTLSDLGDYAGALERYPRVIAGQREAFGETNVTVARSLATYAELLRIVGQHDEARRLLDEAMSIQRQVNGPESAELRTPLLNLATLRIDQHEYAAPAEDLALARAGTRTESSGSRAHLREPGAGPPPAGRSRRRRRGFRAGAGAHRAAPAGGSPRTRAARCHRGGPARPARRSRRGPPDGEVVRARRSRVTRSPDVHGAEPVARVGDPPAVAREGRVAIDDLAGAEDFLGSVERRLGRSPAAHPITRRAATPRFAA